MNEVSLDLTAWARGPFTGVGLSAARTFRALGELGSSWRFEAVSRVKSPTLRKMGPIERFLGNPRKIFHGFEVSLPPVKRSPVVLTVHDLWTLHPNPYQSADFQKRQAPRLAAAIARADRLITPTAAVGDGLAKLRPGIPIAVIPWAPLLTEAEGGESERPYFLCVACLETRKNLATLFEAMHGEKNVDLVLVGAPGFGAQRVHSALERLRASGTRVVHHERIDERKLAGLYRGALALVQPSLDEGFGMPVVEAMRFGTPLVLSTIAAFREVADDAAIYFKDSPGALRDVLAALRNDSGLRARQARLSAARSELFTWRRTAELHLALYSGIS